MPSGCPQEAPGTLQPAPHRIPLDCTDKPHTGRHKTPTHTTQHAATNPQPRAHRNHTDLTTTAPCHTHDELD